MTATVGTVRATPHPQLPAWFSCCGHPMPVGAPLGCEADSLLTESLLPLSSTTLPSCPGQLPAPPRLSPPWLRRRTVRHHLPWPLAQHPEKMEKFCLETYSQRRVWWHSRGRPGGLPNPLLVFTFGVSPGKVSPSLPPRLQKNSFVGFSYGFIVHTLTPCGILSWVRILVLLISSAY